MIAEYKEYKAFYDRSRKSVEGRFSIRRTNGDYIVEKFRARSGQNGFSNTSWTRGRSPVPFGAFNLYTKPNNIGEVAGKTGIGEAFPIDNKGDRLTIANEKNPYIVRREIMLHEENAYKGSAGCIVIVDHADWVFIRDWLKGINAEYPVIPLEVL
jgi:hypothetical protein